MNNRLTISLILAFIFICSQVNSQSRQTSQVNPPDARQWVKEHFAKGKVPPFSFKYGGIDSKMFITRWQYNAEKQVSDEPHTEKYVFSYKDNKSGLLVKCSVTAYTDSPAVEWLLRFSNLSTVNTPVIENADVINYSFTSDQKGTFILHHSQGSNAQRTDFQHID